MKNAKIDERLQNLLNEEIMNRFTLLKKEKESVSPKDTLELIENVVSKHGLKITDFYTEDEIKQIKELKTKDNNGRKEKKRTK